jgi:hypothetical protein
MPDSHGMSLEELAKELYGLPPEEFTAVRNARAKETRNSGDRGFAEQIGRLRKPTTAAWLLNMLARQHPDELARLRQLGQDLREAQENLEGETLRTLDRQRRQLIHTVTGKATALGRESGRQVSTRVAAVVVESLRAALADPAAAAAAGSGLLTDTFEATGLQPVDLEGAVAVAGVTERGSTRGKGATSRRAVSKDVRGRRKALQALEKARQAVDVARERAEAARQDVAEVRDQQDGLERERRRLEGELRGIDRDIKDTTRRLKSAARAQKRADRDESSAQRAVRRAESNVERVG